MVDENKMTKVLKEKVIDYKRFAFILIALTVFLFVGLIVPSEDSTQIQQVILIGLSIISLLFALIFHKKAMKTQEQLSNEE